jgi:hypothetical protein
MAVYGEIAYTRALSSRPPYWRRLAAIALAYDERNDARLEDDACNDAHRDLSSVKGVPR